MASIIVSDFNDEDIELSDFEDFLVEIDKLKREQDVEELTEICICGVPSVQNLVTCHKRTCKVQYFHKDCVNAGTTSVVEDWFCENCRKEDETPTEQRQVPVQETPLESVANTPPEEATPSSSRQTSSEKMKYPKKRFHKTDAVSGAQIYAKCALELVFSGAMFQMGTPLTLKVQELARKLLNAVGESESLFFQKLTEKLWKKAVAVVRGKAWTDQCRSEMWSHFHQLRYSKKLLKSWKDNLDALHVQRGIEEEMFLFQHLLEEIFKVLIKEVMQKDMPVDVGSVSQSDMSESEEQALRYCAGYVPHKLIKRYVAVKSSSTANTFLNILRSWTQHEDEDVASLLEYTTLWLKKQNRGGLFKISDEVFTFFRAMEVVVRMCLQKDNISLFQTADVQVTLFNKICQSKDVMQKWDTITGSLSGEGKRQLFLEVGKCFLKMRCEAFIRAYMMIRKDKDMQASRKGEKALRKQLTK